MEQGVAFIDAAAEISRDVSTTSVRPKDLLAAAPKPMLDACKCRHFSSLGSPYAEVST
jgi:hypothetical protein